MVESQARVRAPEFPNGMEWLNTQQPVTLASLRGKVVVVDFWTYCCINCMHVLPDLKKLEHKYPQELVVIGVHSAKFDTEKETENIRQAILRYEIEHPVVNDNQMRIWEQWGVHAWPTVFLIDPEGKVVGYTSGEGIFAPFDQVISQLITEFDAKGLLKREPLQFELERADMPAMPLSFPGKVLADGDSGRLFIADSNHNRIIITTLEGEILDVVGSGQAGFKDGSFTEACFDHPQGMALGGSTLFVADTENHALRKIELDKKTVTTLAGTGQQADRNSPTGKGAVTPLNSPWDLVLHQGTLYTAMAGPHQIWKMNLTTGLIGPYAGSGREARVDGPLRSAALAQPSGLTTDGNKLYFADSEVSSIRSADLDPNGMVETIVGQDLFEFGDIDGTGHTVRLQHPLGITWYEGVLYVADTYNNKIKKVFPVARQSLTFLGSSMEGYRDGKEPLFNEPGGLSIAGGKLFIADTNNHVIRVADLGTTEVTTLKIGPEERLRGK